MGLIPKFIKEITKNKVYFLQKTGENLYSIKQIKYVSPKKTELKFKKNQKTFKLNESNMLNKYGKKIFFKDYDSQQTIKFYANKKPKLDSDETDAFLGKSFITGFLKSMKGNIYDYFSIIIGALIGFGFGAFITLLIAGGI